MTRIFDLFSVFDSSYTTAVAAAQVFYLFCEHARSHQKKQNNKKNEQDAMDIRKKQKIKMTRRIR